MKLEPDEKELKGSWRINGSSVEADDVSRRIESLTSNYLIKIIDDWSGWNKLFQDPVDKRYWELTYPESDMQGGGPPILKNITIQEAKRKYIF